MLCDSQEGGLNQKKHTYTHTYRHNMRAATAASILSTTRVPCKKSQFSLRFLSYIEIGRHTRVTKSSVIHHAPRLRLHLFCARGIVQHTYIRAKARPRARSLSADSRTSSRRITARTLREFSNKIQCVPFLSSSLLDSRHVACFLLSSLSTGHYVISSSSSSSSTFPSLLPISSAPSSRLFSNSLASLPLLVAFSYLFPRLMSRRHRIVYARFLRAPLSRRFNQTI